MTVEELIKRYNVKDNGDGRIGIYNVKLATAEKAVEEIKSRKPEILAYYKAKRDAAEKEREERQMKIDAIEGLTELKKAIADWDKYHYQFNKCMESECPSGFPQKPNVDIAELKLKYPKASAYLKAENWSFASHYKKSSLGEKALERIINGENYEEVINNMEKSWSDYCEEHMWD